MHPTHSCAAIGDESRYLIENHEKDVANLQRLREQLDRRSQIDEIIKKLKEERIIIKKWGNFMIIYHGRIW